MMLRQLLHPFTALALVFVVAAGIAIRLNEYQLPAYARQLERPAAEMVEAYRESRVAELDPSAPNAAPLYDEAYTFLSGMEEDNTGILPFSQEYFNVYVKESPFGAITLPPPIESIPEDVLENTERYVSQRRDALELLYRAANISRIQWTVKPSLYSRRSWPWSIEMQDVLFQDALHHLLQHNEAGVLRAITSLNAFIRAQEQIDPPIASGRLWFVSDDFYRPLQLLLAYGIENDLFSDNSLDILDSTLTFEENPKQRVLLLDKLKENFWSSVYYSRPERWESSRLYMGSGFIEFGTGLSWFGLRFTARNSMKHMMLYEVMQDRMLSEQTISEIGAIDELFRIEATIYFIDTFYGISTDPFRSSEGFVDAAFFHHQHLLYMLSWEYKAIQRRIALRTAIALEKYRRENDDFPKSLDLLVPAYLSGETQEMAAYFLKYSRVKTCWTLTTQLKPWQSKLMHGNTILYAYPLSTQQQDS